MKTTLMTGLTMLLPVLAQTPDDAISQYGRTINVPLRTERLYAGRSTVVKGAPYSADAVTETTQSLTDGNRIIQRTTQKLYRDVDGRERREESVLATGALAEAEMPHMITITDPVENVSYMLDSQRHTAMRNTGPGAILNWIEVGGGGAGTVNGGLVVTLGGSGAQLAGVPGGRSGPRATPGTQNLREDLGSKNIEGVIAQGTRTTQTIPAGQIGNQLPIKVVDEVWHSAELQMDVLTTHSDPRSAEVTYKLTNISRANPPRTLFEPPADYTVTGAAAGGARSGGRGRGAWCPGGRNGGARGAAPGTQK